MNSVIQERFDVEWNAGAGWQCASDHRFWNRENALCCVSGRQADEKLRKWPMRMMRVDLASGRRTQIL